jgi:hypothetical protein
MPAVGGGIVVVALPRWPNRAAASLAWGAAAVWLLGATPAYGAKSDGQLTLEAVDEASGEPIAARLVLRDARGRLVRVRAPQTAALGDGLYFPGTVTLPLRRGSYQFVVEAGPEYETRPGTFDIDRGAEDFHRVPLRRRVEMGDEGWRAGDLDVALPSSALELTMQARGLDVVAPAIVVNDHGKCRKLANDGAVPLAAPRWTTPAVLDRRAGGQLLLVGGQPLVDVCRLDRTASTLDVLAAAAASQSLVVALTPSAWDLPLWADSGELDAIMLIDRHSLEGDAVEPEGEGRRRNRKFFPGKLGIGQYHEAIYHHLLNCGFRIPPVAGSGAGQAGNPVGANRVYAYCGAEATPEAWRQAVLAGRTVVTNGPLLRPLVEGHPPGQVFALGEGERRSFRIALNLAFYATRQVEYLEIVQNGRAVHQVRLDELVAARGQLPPVEFAESGWFAVRAVTNETGVYQFATSAPYYVEDYRGQPRIARASVQFFLDWLDEAAAHFADDAAHVARIAAARRGWAARMAQAVD